MSLLIKYIDGKKKVKIQNLIIFNLFENNLNNTSNETNEGCIRQALDHSLFSLEEKSLLLCCFFLRLLAYSILIFLFITLRASIIINTILLPRPHYFNILSILKVKFSPAITLNFILNYFYNIICIKVLIYHLFNCMFY